MSFKDILRQIPLFSELSLSEIDSLEKVIVSKKFNKNEYIFQEGERASHLYIVVKGRVKIFKLSSEGKEQILQVVGPQNIFAEAAMFSGEDYPASAQALEASLLFLLEREKLLALIAKNPPLGLKMLSALSLLLRRLNRLVEDLSLKEVQARLAKYLLDQATLSGKDEILLTLKKESLAWSLGTISETLSRNLKRLRDRGIIDIRGKRIKIINRQALLKMSAGQKI